MMHGRGTSAPPLRLRSRRGFIACGLLALACYMLATTLWSYTAVLDSTAQSPPTTRFGEQQHRSRQGQRRGGGDGSFNFASFGNMSAFEKCVDDSRRAGFQHSSVDHATMIDGPGAGLCVIVKNWCGPTTARGKHHQSPASSAVYLLVGANQLIPAVRQATTSGQRGGQAVSQRVPVGLALPSLKPCASGRVADGMGVQQPSAGSGSNFVYRLAARLWMFLVPRGRPAASTQGARPSPPVAVITAIDVEGRSLTVTVPTSSWAPTIIRGKVVPVEVVEDNLSIDITVRASYTPTVVATSASSTTMPTVTEVLLTGLNIATPTKEERASASTTAVFQQHPRIRGAMQRHGVTPVIHATVHGSAQQQPQRTGQERGVLRCVPESYATLTQTFVILSNCVALAIAGRRQLHFPATIHGVPVEQLIDVDTYRQELLSGYKLTVDFVLSEAADPLVPQKTATMTAAANPTTSVNDMAGRIVERSMAPSTLVDVSIGRPYTNLTFTSMLSSLAFEVLNYGESYRRQVSSITSLSTTTLAYLREEDRPPRVVQLMRDIVVHVSVALFSSMRKISAAETATVARPDVVFDLSSFRLSFDRWGSVVRYYRSPKLGYISARQARRFRDIVARHASVPTDAVHVTFFHQNTAQSAINETLDETRGRSAEGSLLGPAMMFDPQPLLLRTWVDGRAVEFPAPFHELRELTAMLGARSCYFPSSARDSLTTEWVMRVRCGTLRRQYDARRKSRAKKQGVVLAPFSWVSILTHVVGRKGNVETLECR